MVRIHFPPLASQFSQVTSPLRPIDRYRCQAAREIESSRQTPNMGGRGLEYGCFQDRSGRDLFLVVTKIGLAPRRRR